MDDHFTKFYDLHMGTPEELHRYVQIDRSTIWGNPFFVQPHSLGNRIVAISNYEKWIKAQNNLFDKMHVFQGKHIICWCNIATQMCHGEALLRQARRIGAVHDALILPKNLLDVQYGIIVHQVNCQGVMGAGLAAEIARRFPEVLRAYQKYPMQPGQVQFVDITPNERHKDAPKLVVCNLAGQKDYGTGLQTDYEAVDIAFKKLAIWAEKKELPVYLPWKMGCNRGGGNWDMYRNIISKHLSAPTYCVPMSMAPELSAD